MPRNAAGVYTLPNPPRVPNTVIDSPDENVTRDDIASELTNSLDRNGRGGMLAPFRIADGTLAAPGLAFLNEPGTGLWRPAAGQLNLVVQGQDVLVLGAAGAAIPAGKTITGNGLLQITGAGPHTLGIAPPNSNVQFTVGGPFTGVTTSVAFQVSTTVNGTANASFYGVIISPTLVRPAAGNHSILTGVRIVPSFPNGGGATADAAVCMFMDGGAVGTGISNATTLLIGGSTGGLVSNQALWVTSGNVRIDGNGPHNISGNANPFSILTLAGTISGPSGGNLFCGFRLTPLMLPGANDSPNCILVAPTLDLSAGSGLHNPCTILRTGGTVIGGPGQAALGASIYIASVVWPAGTPFAAGLYVHSSPTGAISNYSIYSTGLNRHDGLFQLNINDGTVMIGSNWDNPFPLQLNNASSAAGAFANIAFNVGGDAQAAILAYREGAGVVNFMFMTRVDGTRAERGRFNKRGFFMASNNGTYQAVDAENHEFSQVSNTGLIITRFVNRAPGGAASQYGIQIHLFNDPNDTVRYFSTGIGGAGGIERITMLSNGGLRNFQGNNANLSDLTVKNYWEPYTVPQLEALSAAVDAMDFGRYKYKDQTHDDWNHGYVAQDVRSAFGSVAPELVDYWNEEKKDLLAVYSTDLVNINLAVAKHEIRKLKAEIAELKARIH